MKRFTLALLITFGLTSAYAETEMYARIAPENTEEQSALFESQPEALLVSEENALIDAENGMTELASFAGEDAQIILAKSSAEPSDEVENLRPGGKRIACVTQSGGASYYHMPGRKTASGERFSNSSAAHKHWPMGTRVRVTNMATGKQVVVRINDRGPHVRSRVIDLSRASFSQIAPTSQGIARVKIEPAHCSSN